jgi:hypothetical protein
MAGRLAAIRRRGRWNRRSSESRRRSGIGGGFSDCEQVELACWSQVLDEVEREWVQLAESKANELISTQGRSGSLTLAVRTRTEHHTSSTPERRTLSRMLRASPAEAE